MCPTLSDVSTPFKAIAFDDNDKKCTWVQEYEKLLNEALDPQKLDNITWGEKAATEMQARSSIDKAKALEFIEQAKKNLAQKYFEQVEQEFNQLKERLLSKKPDIEDYKQFTEGQLKAYQDAAKRAMHGDKPFNINRKVDQVAQQFKQAVTQVQEHFMQAYKAQADETKELKETVMEMLEAKKQEKVAHENESKELKAKISQVEKDITAAEGEIRALQSGLQQPAAAAGGPPPPPPPPGALAGPPPPPPPPPNAPPPPPATPKVTKASQPKKPAAPEPEQQEAKAAFSPLDITQVKLKSQKKIVGYMMPPDDIEFAGFEDAAEYPPIYEGEENLLLGEEVTLTDLNNQEHTLRKWNGMSREGKNLLEETGEGLTPEALKAQMAAAMNLAGVAEKLRKEEEQKARLEEKNTFEYKAGQAKDNAQTQAELLDRFSNELKEIEPIVGAQATVIQELKEELELLQAREAQLKPIVEAIQQAKTDHKQKMDELKNQIELEKAQTAPAAPPVGGPPPPPPPPPAGGPPPPPMPVAKKLGGALKPKVEAKPQEPSQKNVQQGTPAELQAQLAEQMLARRKAMQGSEEQDIQEREARMKEWQDKEAERNRLETLEREKINAEKQAKLGDYLQDKQATPLSEPTQQQLDTLERQRQAALEHKNQKAAQLEKAETFDLDAILAKMRKQFEEERNNLQHQQPNQPQQAVEASPSHDDPLFQEAREPEDSPLSDSYHSAEDPYDVLVSPFEPEPEPPVPVRLTSRNEEHQDIPVWYAQIMDNAIPAEALLTTLELIFKENNKEVETVTHQHLKSMTNQHYQQETMFQTILKNERIDILQAFQAKADALAPKSRFFGFSTGRGAKKLYVDDFFELLKGDLNVMINDWNTFSPELKGQILSQVSPRLLTETDDHGKTLLHVVAKDDQLKPDTYWHLLNRQVNYEDPTETKIQKYKTRNQVVDPEGKTPFITLATSGNQQPLKSILNQCKQFGGIGLGLVSHIWKLNDYFDLSYEAARPEYNNMLLNDLEYLALLNRDHRIDKDFYKAIVKKIDSTMVKQAEKRVDEIKNDSAKPGARKLHN